MPPIVLEQLVAASPEPTLPATSTQEAGETQAAKAAGADRDPKGAAALPAASDESPTGEAPEEDREDTSDPDADPGEETGPPEPDRLAEAAGALADAAQRLHAWRSDLIKELCDAYGAAAEKALPQLAGRGFAGEVAAASEALACQGGFQTLRLRCSEGELEPITNAVKAVDAEGRFAVMADPSLSAGRVEFAWDQGGALLDADALAAAALRRFDQRLKGIAKEDIQA